MCIFLNQGNFKEHFSTFTVEFRGLRTKRHEKFIERSSVYRIEVRGRFQRPFNTGKTDTPRDRFARYTAI